MGRFQKILMMLFLVVMSFGLAGCSGSDDAFSGDGDGANGGSSGGGSSGGSSGGSGGSLAISLALVDQATGSATTSVSAASPGELRATVTLNGATVGSQVVSFATTIGTLTPSSGLTNTAGLATVVLSDGGTSGAGTITADVTVSGTAATATLNFQVVSSATTTTVDMGSGTGASFLADTIGLGGITDLAAGGTLTATVSIVETSNNNVAYTTPVTVNFTSACVVAGTATMDAAVLTTAGIASSTYLAQGCTGSDTITATADVGTTLNATANFTVQSASVGSLEFVSATPESISLQGTGGSGGTETSAVVFRVVDAQGNPVANQLVNFSLDTVVGGLTLNPTSATSDQNGLVQTVVQSGTVSTSVGVTATTSSGGSTYQTQSSQLVVTTGIPDQDSFSLSASVLTPEAWNHDGVVSVITARLADRFNNPVPDGTAVTFTTEGGSIESSCTTTNGACSVNWTSQAPRPCGQTMGAADVVLDPSLGPNQCVTTGGVANPVDPVIDFDPPPQGESSLGQPYGGRATIVATVVGEESFIDTNGNGVFDDGDSMKDLPEAWVDENEDGVRGGFEPFFDFNANGSYDAADGAFNGVLCNRTVSPLCSSDETLHIRETLVLVMSGSAAYIDVVDGALMQFNAGNNIDLSCDAAVAFTVIYSDLHHQPMPVGTKVTVTSSHGSIVLGGSYTQADTTYNGAIAFAGNIEGTGTADKTNTGLLIVTVETPRGLISQASYPVTETCPP
ncbi:Invasin domain protein [hydrothermal vent metagenome]|uniref:Invasin domain protein n=1 Tax=hydrothermal vent metagenome TaxID=652676 RepID=A0A3B1AV27_9ZZZZ